MARYLYWPRGALRLLRARPATLAVSDVDVGSVPDVQTDVVEVFASGTEIAVAFRLISKLLGAVERAVLSWITIAGSHVRGDVPLRQPLQELAVAIGGIGGQRLRGSCLAIAGKRAIMSWAATVS